MRNRYKSTILLTTTFAIVLAAVPLWRLALTPAQAQQEGPPPHQSGMPIVGEALPPENPLPTLELTGYQAKAVMQAVETFTADATKLSPGVSTDLARYRLRLIHHNIPSTFTGIFERDGVSVPVPWIEAKSIDSPEVTIDGDELKALFVVVQAIRDPKNRLPKHQQYHFDYDITNYDVRIQRDNRDKDVIHVSCDSQIFGVYWPKLADKSDKKPAVLAGSSLESQGGFWQFEVSRKSYQIGTIYFTGI